MIKKRLENDRKRHIYSNLILLLAHKTSIPSNHLLNFFWTLEAHPHSAIQFNSNHFSSTNFINVFQGSYSWQDQN